MKNKGLINRLFQSDKFVFVFSVLVAVIIWVMVVINASSHSTKIIKDVKVTIDTSVPAQFDLDVFGESEFYVDVTVSGKKYLISNLTEKDVVVNAVTNNVNSVGVHSLALYSEAANGQNEFTVSALSQKNVNVYFDTTKTVQLVVEPEIVTNGSPIVSEGFTSGDINLSESSVTITGPSAEINKINRVVTRYVLKSPLVSNMSAETELIPLDENNRSDFQYLEMSAKKVVLTIPVFKVKTADAIVTFKNAPDNYVVTPLEYSITPGSADFDILVDEYDKTTQVSVGTIDFKNLYPGNDTFVFKASDVAVSGNSVSEFEVKVNLEDFSQEYIKVSEDKIVVNNPNNLEYKISGLNKSVAVVGKKDVLNRITEDMISIEVDLSTLAITEGETVSLPAVVTVSDPSCWVCGTYMVEVTL